MKLFAWLWPSRDKKLLAGAADGRTDLRLVELYMSLGRLGVTQSLQQSQQEHCAKILHDLLQRPGGQPVSASKFLMMNGLERAENAELARDDRPVAEQPRFVIDTQFVRRSFAHCVPKRDKSFKEEFHFCAGVNVGDWAVATHLLPVAYRSHSAGEVVVDPQSSTRALEWMHAAGLQLVATVHSHPGAGPAQPSQRDLAMQQSYEKIGYRPLGLIFTADRLIRAFGPTNFTITFAGNGVETVDDEEHIYRLVEMPDLARAERQLSVEPDNDGSG